jgi:hypothetical protein
LYLSQSKLQEFEAFTGDLHFQVAFKTALFEVPRSLVFNFEVCPEEEQRL